MRHPVSQESEGSNPFPCTNIMKENIDLKDILQISAGSLAAAIVLAPSYELLQISKDLPIYKLVLIFIITLIFIGIIAYFIGVRKLELRQIITIAYVIPVRVVVIYSISIISCLVALWLYDFINFDTSPTNVVRQVIVLSLPATWGGTLLDLIYSKNK